VATHLPFPAGARTGLRRVPTSLNQAGRLALMHGPDHWVKPPAVFGLRIRGRIEIEVLQQAVTAIARRHSALRMFFPPDSSPDWAACLDPADIAWDISITDLADLTGTGLAAAERRAVLALQAAFAPTAPPLFRGTLIRYGTDDWLLGIAVDHMIFDGASFVIFLRELEMLYMRIRQGHDPASLNLPTSDFASFAAAERDWLDTAAAGHARAYWQPIWDGAGPYPRACLPARAPNTGERSGKIRRVTLPAAAVAAIQRQFPYGHLSLFALTASAALIAQGQLTGRTDCALLHSGARRSTSQAADMIGYLTNRVLLRVQLPANAGLYEVAATTRNTILDSLEHEMMPFEHLIDLFSPEHAGRRPDTSYVFLSVDTPPVPPKLGDAQVAISCPMIGDAFGEVPWLSIDLDQSAGDELTLSCGYQTPLFSDEFIGDFMADIAALLTSPGKQRGRSATAQPRSTPRRAADHHRGEGRTPVPAGPAAGAGQ